MIRVATTLSLSSLLVQPFARSECSADQRHSGFAERDRLHRWQITPAPAPEIWPA